MSESSFQIHSRTLQDYARMLIKRRWVVVTGLAIVLGTAMFRNYTETPMYQATVQLLIERQPPRILDQQGVASYEMYNEEYYQTQYKLLASRALAKMVVDKMHLREHPYYSMIFKSLPPNASKAQRQHAEEGLVGAIAGGVTVTPLRESNLVNVSYTHPDPKFAADLVNTLAQCYIDLSLDLRFSASREAAAWLRGKVNDARKSLEQSEAVLNQYKREQNIVTLTDKESITSEKLEQLNRDLLKAQTRRMELETRYKEVSAGQPIAEVFNTPMVESLRTQEARLIAEQSELSQKYGPSHPRMLQLAQELATIRGKINSEIHQVEQTIKNEYSMAKAQEDNLGKALDETKEATQDLSDRAIKYRTLLRDVETNRAMYQNVLKSLKTVTATENLPSTNIRIVYPATIPQVHISPRISHNLFIATILGLGLGFLAAVTLETLDTTLKTPDDLERWLAVPNLALVPHLDFSKGKGAGCSELFVHLGTEPLASEAYRGLRTSILFSAPGHSPKALLVTSSMPGEGKTVTAANLASVMAKAEAGVLLMDTDLRRPCLHRMFQIPIEPGLSNYLVGDIDDPPVVETLVSNLFLMPAGKMPPNPSELLGSERMRELLTRLQQQFGRVILDSPPLITVTDAAILATLVEGVLLVIRAEAVPRKAAMEARDKLKSLKAPLLGTIFNRVPTHREGYYHYYYRYRSYYHYHRQAEEHPSAIAKSPGWLNIQLAAFKKKYLWR